MRFAVYLALLILLGCSSGSQKTPTPVDTTHSQAKTDTTQPSDYETQVHFRDEFISLYQKPVLVDTFFLDKTKRYRVLFHHFSTMDNGLVVPAKYNFDTNKDFVTHNFVSDLTVFLDKDTVFKKHIPNRRSEICLTPLIRR